MLKKGRERHTMPKESARGWIRLLASEEGVALGRVLLAPEIPPAWPRRSRGAWCTACFLRAGAGIHKKPAPAWKGAGAGAIPGSRP